MNILAISDVEVDMIYSPLITQRFKDVDLVIDFQTQKVTLREQSVQLTNKEFAVLAVLARNAPKVVNYQTIAQQVWGMDTPDVRKRIKYLVYIIRRKFQTLDP